MDDLAVFQNLALLLARHYLSGVLEGAKVQLRTNDGSMSCIPHVAKASVVKSNKRGWKIGLKMCCGYFFLNYLIVHCSLKWKEASVDA